MTASWFTDLVRRANGAPVVRVTMLDVAGSTPREAGAAMIVSATELTGTIGGGALEFEAIKAAREIIGQCQTRGSDTVRWHREIREYPLGPALCQCCGGFTWVLFEHLGHAELQHLQAIAATLLPHGALIARPLMGDGPLVVFSDRKAAGDFPVAMLRAARDMLSGAAPMAPRLIEGTDTEPAWFLEPAGRATVPLFLYGAGHVGREIVRVIEGLSFDLTWVDTARDRFPDTVPAHAHMTAVKDPAAFALMTPPGAFHLVMTYAHPLDETICTVLLKRGDFAYLGLIGSKTKRARFEKRFRAAGIADTAIQRLTCPIGISGVTGKEPPVIAVAAVAELIAVLEQRRSAGRVAPEPHDAIRTAALSR
jgi:xanthine dehydrogenase accessory factor